MAHSPGPFTVQESPDTAERALGLTHMICAPCQIPEEQGEPVAVAFTFNADDAVLFASVLDLLEAAEGALSYLATEKHPGTSSLCVSLTIAIAKTRGVA